MPKGKPIPGVTWRGTDGDDSYVGTAGDDSLSGSLGNDTIDGGAGNDRLYGNEGDDVLFGGLGNDTIMGHEGMDAISGGDGDDSLYGQEGDDTVAGGAGNDTLGAGPGNDLLTGGLGADRFFFASNFAEGLNVHTINDFNRAEGDIIDLRSIDADGDSSNNPRRGNTDFTIVDGPSEAAGTLWMISFTDPLTGSSGVSIYLNTDADPEPDTRIDVLDVSSLTWGVDFFG